MNIGSFSERILIKTPSSGSTDAYGQVIPSYSTSSLWANVVRLGGSENNSSGVQYSAAQYTFTIRNYATGSGVISESSHIVYNNHSYNLTFVDVVPYSNSRYLKLTGQRQP